MNFNELKRLIVFIIITLFIVATHIYIEKLKSEVSLLRGNQELLLSDNEGLLAEQRRYKVADSLNAVKVSSLELTLEEYKRFKEKDAKLIEHLRTSNMNLKGVVSTQMNTLEVLSAKLKDSIKIDTVTLRADTLKCFSYTSQWVEVKGCVDLREDTLGLQIVNKESLKIVETVRYKRFLGFLWKTNKIKERNVDVLSLNPNTQIVSCEYVTIE
jgi:hypothetical protein